MAHDFGAGGPQIHFTRERSAYELSLALERNGLRQALADDLLRIATLMLC